MTHPNAVRPRILVIDVENSPNLGWTWEKWQTNILQFVQEWHLLTVAWKWKDEKRIHSAKLSDFPLYKTEPDNDRELAKLIHHLFNEADIIVGHNVKEFDIRKVNTRFWEHRLTPTSPYKVVDTLKVLRAKGSLNSYKLGDVCQWLFGEQKIDTGGIGLWLRCLEGDEKALLKMERYNRHDIHLTDKLYDFLRPWDDYHPNVTLGRGLRYACPACGSQNTIRHKTRYLKAWVVEQFKCKEKDCGRYSSGPRVRYANSKEVLQ